MTLEEFAEQGGVTIIEGVDAERWGGAFGYTTADDPKVSMLGAVSIEACYNDWLDRSFGEDLASVVRSLLEG